MDNDDKIALRQYRQATEVEVIKIVVVVKMPLNVHSTNRIHRSSVLIRVWEINEFVTSVVTVPRTRIGMSNSQYRIFSP